MSNTPNLNLSLTPADDTTTTFKAWRTAMNGTDGNSNMSKIDEAYGNLNKDCKNISAKVDAVSSKVYGDAPKTWKDVQNIVRSGAAAQYFDVGDQFIAEKLTAVTASVGTSTGISAASVDADGFIEGCGEVKAGEYTFSFDGKSWRGDDGKTIKIADYGISVTGTPKAGDHIVVTETTTSLAFDVIGIEHDTPSDTNYTHSMTLQLHDLWKDYMVFDAYEVLLVAKQALPAGTYNITLDHGAYGSGTAEDATYQFTTTKEIPIGGAIKHTQMGAWTSSGYSTSRVAAGTFSTYETASSTAALESGLITTIGSGGINLGTATANNPAYRVETDYCSVNFTERNFYGSNNWAESAMRQWLNTDGAANTWWEAKTIFDRPANASSAGFLNKLDPAFLDVIGTVTKKTQQSIADGYGMDVAEERFFLLSRPEVFAGVERSADGSDGDPYEFYGSGYSDYTSPNAGEDSNRIKYRSGTAYYWWLRTPNSGHGSNVRRVNPTGYLSNNYAYNSIGVAPACVIV